MREFGTKSPGHRYIPRPSAYAIAFDKHGRVGAVRYRDTYFLPGGGVEDGESHEEAVHRELREETGWTVSVKATVGEAAEYIYARLEDRHYQKIGRFVLAEVVSTNGVRTETDHHPVWVTVEEFAARANHASHVWAVNEALAIVATRRVS